VSANDWQAKLWSRFFCLSVFVTMYLNDNQRAPFYESIGLDTKQFNQHVIIETNRTTARIFPEVIDVENPEFFKRLDQLVVTNTQLIALGKSDSPFASIQKVRCAPVPFRPLSLRTPH
jgi:magnesium-protoporphyrin IX monomethyl ester (oxidative) cyclase